MMEGLHDKIVIGGVRKEFRTRRGVITAIDNLSLSVKEGEFCIIVGPSGCGKTTLLRILAGLEEPSAGEIRFNRAQGDRPLNSMVFQEQSVFPWMTVRQNVAYGLTLRRVNPRERDAIVSHYLRMVGLDAFADLYPHQLSGGMKQRVSVARAFANDPEILLMDEPFAALDEQTRALLQEELLRIWEATGKTVVFVTHSIDEAIVLGDRVVVMSARPGRVKRILDVEIGRPRRAYELRASPAYTGLVTEIWGLLREEVVRTLSGDRLVPATLGGLKRGR